MRDLAQTAGRHVLAGLGETVTTPDGDLVAVVDPGDEEATLRRRSGADASDHGLETGMRRMRLLMAAEDALAQGATVTVRGTTYEVAEVRPHGPGLVEAELAPGQPNPGDDAVWR